MSQISYRVGSPPTAADAKRQKRQERRDDRAPGTWVDFVFAGIWELTMTCALVFFIATPWLTGHR